MTFTINSSLLDAIVLSVVSIEDTYGYKITQEVNNIINISESTLYPVLRRLQKNNDLETYDVEYLGRNRRYYKITEKGKKLLEVYKEEWKIYKSKIDRVFEKDFSESQQDSAKSFDIEDEMKSENLKIGDIIKNFKLEDKIESLHLQERLDKLDLGGKIDRLKIPERINSLKVDDFLENFVSGFKGGKNKHKKAGRVHDTECTDVPEESVNMPDDNVQKDNDGNKN